MGALWGGHCGVLRATLIKSKGPALQGSCTHDWVVSGRRGPGPAPLMQSEHGAHFFQVLPSICLQDA